MVRFQTGRAVLAAPLLFDHLLKGRPKGDIARQLEMKEAAN